MKKETPFSDLRKRSIINGVFSLVFALFLFFVEVPLIHFGLFPALLAAVSFAAAYEAVQLFAIQSPVRSPLLLSGMVAICVVFPLFGTFSQERVLAYLIALFAGIYHLYAVEGAVHSLFSWILVLIYIALPLSTVGYLIFPGDGFPTVLHLVFVIVATKISDIGGYFFGKTIGGPKLMPTISPKKTIAGAVGGLFLSIVVGVLFARSLEISPVLGGFLGGSLGILGQIGDLIESMIKRDVGVKDSGKIPGVGGVLDTLDSLLVTLPAYALYLSWTV